MLREELGDAKPSPRAGLEQVVLPRREARCPRRWLAPPGARACPQRPRTRIRHAAGRGYPDLVRLRTGELDAAPDAGVAPATRTGRRRARGLRGGGVAVVPFGGGTASSAASSPSAVATTGLIALDLRRLRDVEVDRTSLTATLGPGLRGPEAEAALARAGAHARPLPAVVRVRDDRRLRRDPLGRPGLERLRALRRSRHLAADDHPGGALRDARDAAHGRRAGAARAGPRLGGHARRDHRGRPCGCARRPRRRYEA